MIPNLQAPEPPQTPATQESPGDGAPKILQSDPSHCSQTLSRNSLSKPRITRDLGCALAEPPRTPCSGQVLVHAWWALAGTSPEAPSTVKSQISLLGWKLQSSTCCQREMI